MTIASKKSYSELEKVVWNLIRTNVRLAKILIISSEGIRVDPSKTDEISKMSVPQSLPELQR